MDTQAVFPETAEERVVWHALRLTYVFYVLGALYVVAPVIAWSLLMLLLLRLWQGRLIQPGSHRKGLPWGIWLWIIGMLVMQIALVVGHLDFQLGIAKTIKSSIGWAKGWALLAIFPLLGMLQIRPAVIYRAAMHVCLHTLLLMPVFVLAWLVGLPQTLYVSPLQAIGGPGPEFFAMSLYEIDPGSGNPRWRLFTPWAPALGFVANIFFIFALQEKSSRWRWIGITASLVMVLISGSRLALIALVLTWQSTWFIAQLRHWLAPFAAALLSMVAGLLGSFLLDAYERFWLAFRAARAGSSRVRDALGRIAVERWSNEAPVWGHGIVERGPHLVEFMPIGSHHSWYGLLFVKGIVGAAALALPLFFSLLQMVIWAGRLVTARVGLAMTLLLFLYTFGENLEILAYLIWPGLVVLGIAHREIHQRGGQPQPLTHVSTGEPQHVS